MGGTSAGARFAAAHGYEVANTEGFKVLDLRDHHRQVEDMLNVQKVISS